MHTTIRKRNMGYIRTYFCCFPLALANTFSWSFVPTLSNFFEEQWTQNHPQCLSGFRVHFFRQVSRNSCKWLPKVVGLKGISAYKEYRIKMRRVLLTNEAWRWSLLACDVIMHKGHLRVSAAILKINTYKSVSRRIPRRSDQRAICRK